MLSGERFRCCVVRAKRGKQIAVLTTAHAVKILAGNRIPPAVHVTTVLLDIVGSLRHSKEGYTMLTDPAPEHFDTSGILQAKQFVDHTRENQGASMDAYTGRFAQVGTDHGWMVGGHPDSATGKQIPGRQLKGVSEIPLHEAHAHIVKAAILGNPGDRQFVGSWDDRHGNIALDNSTKIDKMAVARKEGNTRGQEGMFGLQNHRILHPEPGGDTEEFGNNMELRRGGKLAKQRVKQAAAGKRTDG